MEVGSRKSESRKSESRKSVQMASLVVPLFLTPPARAIGRARRGATGMAGRAVLAWSSYRQGRASSARGPPLTSSGVLAFWVRQGSVKAAMAAGAMGRYQ